MPPGRAATRLRPGLPVLRLRVLLLPLGVASLLAGLAGGLARMGWNLPAPAADWALLHGPLMVGGFFGTLIAFERAVAMRSAWVFAAPLLLGAGGLMLIAGAPAAAAAVLTAGSLVYLVAGLRLVTAYRELFIITMAIGAACWLAGNLLWMLGDAVDQVVPWWMAFLVLTIAGERQELSRLTEPPASARAAFGAAMLVFVAGAAMTVAAPASGWRVLGGGLVLLTAWLLRHDVARRTLHVPGLPRFSATCLLSGYAWLLIAGIMALAAGDPAPGGFLYDAMLHAVFLGFVFGMVFGHAPIILPAVARLPVRFHRGFYGPLALLHAGLLLRVLSDFAAWIDGRMWGGLIGAIAILLFAGVTALAARKGRAPAASL